MNTITTPLFCMGLLLLSSPSTQASEVRFEDTEPVKLMSWSGGGVRGLTSLYLAQAVDHHLGGGIDLLDRVDWHFGTSTGGIISLALANGNTLHKCIEIYENKADRIFQTDNWSWWRAIRGMWTETYTDQGLVEVLHEELGENTKFRDIGRASKRRGPDVVVTAYDVWNKGQGKTPYLFNSINADIQDIDLWKGARSSVAAPSYIPAYAGIEGHVFLDGGMYANDPSEAGLETIRPLYDVTQPFNLLSFGTGVYNQSLTAEQAAKRGKLDWAVGISDLLMDASTQSIERGLRGDLGHRYVKLDPILDHIIALDGTSAEELAELRDLALTYVRDHPERIDQAAKLMTD